MIIIPQYSEMCFELSNTNPLWINGFQLFVCILMTFLSGTFLTLFAKPTACHQSTTWFFVLSFCCYVKYCQNHFQELVWGSGFTVADKPHALYVITMRWVPLPPGLLPWELCSAGNAAVQSTSSGCCSPRSPSSRLLHSAERHIFISGCVHFKSFRCSFNI